MKKTEQTLIHYICDYCGVDSFQNAADVMHDGSGVDTTIEDDVSITHYITLNSMCESCEIEIEGDCEIEIEGDCEIEIEGDCEIEIEGDFEYWDEEDDWEEIMEWEQMQEEIGY